MKWVSEKSLLCQDIGKKNIFNIDFSCWKFGDFWEERTWVNIIVNSRNDEHWGWEKLLVWKYVTSCGFLWNFVHCPLKMKQFWFLIFPCAHVTRVMPKKAKLSFWSSASELQNLVSILQTQVYKDCLTNEAMLTLETLSWSVHKAQCV